MNLDPKAYANMDDFRDALHETRSAIDEALEGFEEINDEVSFEKMGEFVKRVKAKPNLKYYPTGMFWLDSNLFGAGLPQGSLINIAGASYTGKTTLILETLKGLAGAYKVAFFSYEMYEKILIRKFTYAPFNVLQNITIIQDSPFIETICKRIKILHKQGVDIFAIDSRMKLRTHNSRLTEYERNNEISSRLSELTRTLGVIIILINQISEADLKAGRLSLKGSGDQVYDSDMVIYLSADFDERHIVKNRWLTMAKDRIGEKTFRIDIPDFYEQNIIAAQEKALL